VYWAASEPYHAFGLGAASLLGARRFARPRAMGAYRAWLEGFAWVRVARLQWFPTETGRTFTSVHKQQTVVAF